MNQKLLESALQKCAQAAVDALGQKYDKLYENGENVYSDFAKEFFKKPDRTKCIWNHLTKVSDVVTEEELQQLLRWPDFYRGWNFAQRYLFEEKCKLNKKMHAAVEQCPHRLMSVSGTDYTSGPGGYGQVEVVRVSPSFRLMEIRIAPRNVRLQGSFVLEITKHFCIVLCIGAFWLSQGPFFVFDALSPRMMERLEHKTKKVRHAIGRRYFPVRSYVSLESWRRELQVDSSNICVKDAQSALRKDKAKRSLRMANKFLKKKCKEENLASKREWAAFKKAFGLGKIIRLRDRDLARQRDLAFISGRRFMNYGEQFEVIRLELPYDIEIPVYSRNGVLYLVRSISKQK